MDFKLLMDGILVGLSVSIPLGPIGVLVIQRTISRGQLSGFISGMGAGLSDTVYAIIAGFSVSFVITFFEAKHLFLQIIGGAILLFIGFRIFYSNPARQLRRQQRSSSNLFGEFFSVFAITITNPVILFLFVAVFAGFGILKDQRDILDTWVVITGVLIGTAIWWFLLSLIVSLFRHKINLRRLWWINKIAGAAIVALTIIGAIYLALKEIFNFELWSPG